MRKGITMNGKALKSIPLSAPRDKRESKAAQKKHDEHDDCFCEQPITDEEATPDEHLPPTTGGVE